MTEVSNHAMKRLVDLAERQEGLVTTAQLRAAGLSDEAISRWASTRRLHLVFRTVYALGRQPMGARTRLRAATLACPGAAISHRSAAALLGIGKVAPLVVDVIPTEQRGRKIDGIQAHRVAFPKSSELVRAHGIPCTSVARTIVDLAGVHGEAQMRGVFARAAARKVLDLGAIERVLDGGTRRRGAPCLRRVIADWRPVVAKTNYGDVRSLFEAKLLPLIAAADLPVPQVNALVRTPEETFEADLLWPTARFIVEADGRAHHGTDLAFERDRHRDRELLAADHHVLRVTWREAEREPEKVLAVIRSQLGRLRGAGSTSPT
jgi:very-short-patch-repair endonuclease